MPLHKGQLIEHDAFGPGVVKGLVDGGRRAWVEFEKLPGVPYTLPTSQLSVVGKSSGATVVEPATTKAKPSKAKPCETKASRARTSKAGSKKTPLRAEATRSANRSDPAHQGAPPPPVAPSQRSEDSFVPSARQLFEALRMGVVPPTLLDRYTVGRDEEVQYLVDFVAGRRGLMVIEGHYGTGKTHLIALGANEALQAGYLVSRVSFDAVEVPASNPLRIYRELVANLQYPPEGIQGGLTPLLSRLLTSGRHKRNGTAEFHRYLSPALFALADGSAETSEGVMAFVEARGGSSADDVRRALGFDGWRGPKLLAMPDWRTFGQVLLYLVGGIASWAEDAGFSGLALFFDEAESVDQLGRVSRQFAETIVRYFAAATLPSSQLPFDAEALYRGGQRVHRGLPHRFCADQPLLSCFALTPLPEVAQAVRAAGVDAQRLLVLDELSPSDITQLVARLADLYHKLYPALTIDRQLLRLLETHVDRGVSFGLFTNIRQVTRLTVEYLDLLRHRPERAADALETL